MLSFITRPAASGSPPLAAACRAVEATLQGQIPAAAQAVRHIANGTVAAHGEETSPIEQTLPREHRAAQPDSQPTHQQPAHHTQASQPTHTSGAMLLQQDTQATRDMIQECRQPPHATGAILTSQMSGMSNKWHSPANTNKRTAHEMSAHHLPEHHHEARHTHTADQKAADAELVEEGTPRRTAASVKMAPTVKITAKPSLSEMRVRELERLKVQVACKRAVAPTPERTRKSMSEMRAHELSELSLLSPAAAGNRQVASANAKGGRARGGRSSNEGGRGSKEGGRGSKESKECLKGAVPSKNISSFFTKF